jgi:hypothetical protein
MRALLQADPDASDPAKTSVLQRSDWISEIDRLYGKEITPATFREAGKFILSREVRGLLDTLTKEPEEVLAHIRKTSDNLSPMFALGAAAQEAVDFFSDEYLAKRKADMDTYVTEERIPIGWKPVDDATGGGMRRGEVVIFMAGSGSGKTQGLVNIAKQQMELGYRVLFLDMDNVQSEVESRMFACVTGVSMNDLQSVDDQHTALKAWKSLHATEDAWRYKELQPYTLTPSSLRGLIMTMDDAHAKVISVPGQPTIIHGFDVVFIDYGEQILPEKGGSYDADRLKIGSVFEGFRGIGKELKKLMVAATQANRNKYFAKLKKNEVYQSGQGDVSESYGKVFPCQLGLAWDQTDGEKAMNPPAGRLSVWKNRHGPWPLTFSFTGDFSRARMQPDHDNRALELLKTPVVQQEVKPPTRPVVTFSNTRYQITEDSTMVEPTEVVD